MRSSYKKIDGWMDGWMDGWIGLKVKVHAHARIHDYPHVAIAYTELIVALFSPLFCCLVQSVILLPCVQSDKAWKRAAKVSMFGCVKMVLTLN